MNTLQMLTLHATPQVLFNDTETSTTMSA